MENSKEKFTLVLTKEELEALAQFIDAGVRAQGLSSVKPAAYIIQKLETAVPVEQKEE